MEMVELLVRMDCTGCERTVRKALRKMKGIDSIEVDLRQCKVTVTGNVDPKKVLKAVRKTGKRAEFWPDFKSYDGVVPELEVKNYIKHGPAFSRTYNYVKHGSNNNHSNTLSHDAHDAQATYDPPHYASTLFSDENPNACFIM